MHVSTCAEAALVSLNEVEQANDGLTGCDNASGSGNGISSALELTNSVLGGLERLKHAGAI